VALEVDDGQHAGFGLEAQHALIRGLVLPRARADQGGAPEIQAFVAVNVPGDKDVRDFTDNQTVLRFR